VENHYGCATLVVDLEAQLIVIKLRKELALALGKQLLFWLVVLLDGEVIAFSFDR